jgi:hypothetical protein
LGSPLTTRDTVMAETPALRATSWIVTLPRERLLTLLTLHPPRSVQGYGAPSPVSIAPRPSLTGGVAPAYTW